MIPLPVQEEALEKPRKNWRKKQKIRDEEDYLLFNFDITRACRFLWSCLCNLDDQKDQGSHQAIN